MTQGKTEKEKAEEAAKKQAEAGGKVDIKPADPELDGKGKGNEEEEEDEKKEEPGAQAKVYEADKSVSGTNLLQQAMALGELAEKAFDQTLGIKDAIKDALTAPSNTEAPTPTKLPEKDGAEYNAVAIPTAPAAGASPSAVGDEDEEEKKRRPS